MAKKKQEKEAKIVIERVYVVPLRREWLKVPKYKRAAKAIRGLREFLIKHMKSTDIKIGKYLNEAIWSRGMRNPLHKVKVEAKKDEKGVVFAEIVGAPVEKKEEGKKEKKGKEEKGKIEETKKEKVKEKKESTPAALEKEAKVAGKEKPKEVKKESKEQSKAEKK